MPDLTSTLPERLLGGLLREEGRDGALQERVLGLECVQFALANARSKATKDSHTTRGLLASAGLGGRGNAQDEGAGAFAGLQRN